MDCCIVQTAPSAVQDRLSSCTYRLFRFVIGARRNERVSLQVSSDSSLRCSLATLAPLRPANSPPHRKLFPFRQPTDQKSQPCANRSADEVDVSGASEAERSMPTSSRVAPSFPCPGNLHRQAESLPSHRGASSWPLALGRRTRRRRRRGGPPGSAPARRAAPRDLGRQRVNLLEPAPLPRPGCGVVPRSGISREDATPTPKHRPARWVRNGSCSISHSPCPRRVAWLALVFRLLPGRAVSPRRWKLREALGCGAERKAEARGTGSGRFGGRCM